MLVCVARKNLLTMLQELSDFEDGESLATLLGPALQPGAPGVSNLTVRVDTRNDSETVTLESYASIVTIVTPAQYACNVSLLMLLPTMFGMCVC